MVKRLCLIGLLAPLSLAQHFPVRTPFVDVPPCHWAAPAIARIAGMLQIDPLQQRTSNYLAENSLRQVFEGLRCDDLAWSGEFITEVPAGVSLQPGLRGFELRQVVSAISGEQATVDFELVAVIGNETLTRRGQVELAFIGGRWLVRYPSLAALELPFFP